MKNWVKILIAFVGSGLNGGCAYLSGQFPEWAIVFGAAATLVSVLMSKLIGWPPQSK